MTSSFHSFIIIKVECNSRNRELNSKIPPPPILVLANSNIRILSNEIQANCTIKREPLQDNGMLEFGCIFLHIGNVIHLSKWRILRRGFLSASRRVYQLLTKFGPSILPFDCPDKSLNKNVHL